MYLGRLRATLTGAARSIPYFKSDICFGTQPTSKRHTVRTSERCFVANYGSSSVVVSGKPAQSPKKAASWRPNDESLSEVIGAQPSKRLARRVQRLAAEPRRTCPRRPPIEGLPRALRVLSQSQQLNATPPKLTSPLSFRGSLIAGHSLLYHGDSLLAVPAKEHGYSIVRIAAHWPSLFARTISPKVTGMVRASSKLDWFLQRGRRPDSVVVSGKPSWRAGTVSPREPISLFRKNLLNMRSPSRSLVFSPSPLEADRFILPLCNQAVERRGTVKDWRRAMGYSLKN